MGTNVAAHVPRMAALQPDAPAILFPKGAGRYATQTYRQLDEDSDRIALGLERLGISRGVRTAFFVRPSSDFFALTFALFKLGAVPVMIDPGMGPKAIGACIAEAAPTGFIGIGKAHLARKLLGWGKDSVSIKVAVGTRLGWGGKTLEQVRSLGAGGRFTLADTAPDETAAILFTSGSTGPPKGAVYTHGVFCAQVDMLRDLYGIEPGEIDLPTFPLFALFDPALGMTTVVPEMDFAAPANVDPQAILDPIRALGVTNLFGNPALLRQVTSSQLAREAKLPTLRRVLSAGAPVPADVLARTQRMLGEGVQIFTPYGATEVLPVCSIGSDEILSETAEETRAGAGVCVGRPVPPNDVRVIRTTDEPIAQWEDAEELPAGEIGEVVVKGPTVTHAYFERPRQTALAKIADGAAVRHRMGDLGYFDDRGRLWFCGRKSHRVESAEGTLFTLQCEPLFQGTARVALVGVPGADGKQEPVLCAQHPRWNDREPPPHMRVDHGSWDFRRTRLREIAAEHAATAPIRRFLEYPKRFPVDPRHNAKIRREELRDWAERQLR